MGAARIFGLMGAGLATGVALALGRSALRSSSSTGKTATGKLSARREKALAIVNAVVPSKFGDARWNKLAPGYDPNDPKLPPGFTTCAYLPGHVASELGFSTKYGLASIRDIAKADGAWIEGGGGREPKLGDFFVLGDGKGGIAHVGVAIDGLRKTADAGQGSRDAQEARFVDRAFDAQAGTVTTYGVTRPVLGWMDIEKMPVTGKAVAGLGAKSPPRLLVDGGLDGGETTPAKRRS